MNKADPNKYQEIFSIPKLWQGCVCVLLILITSLLFINDSQTKYSIDLTVSILNIIAVLSGFFLCKKKLSPWGLLILATVLVNTSFSLNSLIFFGYEINTNIPLWLEFLGIIALVGFSFKLLYKIEKHYRLNGITIDYTLVALSATSLVFLFSPELLSTVIHKLDTYEKSLVLNVVIGTVFISLMIIGFILSNKIKGIDVLLGIVVFSISIHFYLDAYLAFFNLQENIIIERLSWFLYQLSLVISILYIFYENQEYDLKHNKAKIMGLKLLWIATITSLLIVPISVIIRWALDFSIIDTFTLATISGIMSLLLICRVVLLIKNYERQRQKLKNIAYTDSLTGISNYLGLQTHIPKLENVFVLLMNIEDFKSINDMYDRKYGDEVLKSLAKRISNTEEVLYSARTTADNFLVVFQVEEDGIYEVFSKFQEEVSLWDTVFNRSVAVPLTFGGSHSTKPEEIDILVSNAERALKHSREHKIQFTLYENSEDGVMVPNNGQLPRLELREILQRAIDKNELPIHFQPIYETVSGNLKALEMLIRVDSMKHGLLMPGQFLEQAKSSGLLTELTHVCVNMIAKEIDRLPDVTINVNLPPYMLDDTDTLEKFIALFASHKLPPERFCIEVTEDGDIPTESLVPAANLLKQSGFSIAMDDFGTGYSSLGRLSSLPFDTVKIDRSLLLAADEGNKTFLESAITMVKRLGVSVVVEGVETVEQLKLVRDLGADSVQGYLFSKPVPVIDKKQFPLNAVNIIQEF